LESCVFSGAVTPDRLVAGPGPIDASCAQGVALHLIAVQPTGVAIRGPTAIRAKEVTMGPLYELSFLVGATPLPGRTEVQWTTAPSCEALVTLNPYGGSVFVIPKGAGSCTLPASTPDGWHAQLALTIE
jgi:hypothetical protein